MTSLSSLAARYRQIATNLKAVQDSNLIRLLSLDYDFVAHLLSDAIRKGRVETLVEQLRGNLNRREIYPECAKRNATLQVVANTIERTYAHKLQEE